MNWMFFLTFAIYWFSGLYIAYFIGPVNFIAFIFIGLVFFSLFLVYEFGTSISNKGGNKYAKKD